MKASTILKKSRSAATFMELRAVIFDFGGVLLRTEERTYRQNLAIELGMDYEQIDQLVFSSLSGRRAAQGLMSVEEHWEVVGKTLALSSEQLKDFRIRFFAGDRLDEELVETLRDLHKRYQTALLSNAWDDLRDHLQDTWHIADAFDQIIISSEVTYTKPDPRIYWLALDRLGVSPEQALFIDDFIENIESAQRIGMQVIHFVDPLQAKEKLNRILSGGT